MHYETLVRDESKMEDATNPAEFTALANTKQQIFWDHWLSLKGSGWEQ